MEEILNLSSTVKVLENPLVNVEFVLIALESVGRLDMYPLICELLTCVMQLYALDAVIQNVKGQHLDGVAQRSLKNFYNKSGDVGS